MLISRLRQYCLFALTGAMGTGLALLLTYIFTEIFDWWYLWSYVVGTFLAWTFNFYINFWVTFQGHARTVYWGQYLHFVALYVVAFTCNATAVFFLTSIAGWHYLLSIVAVTVVISFFTFWWSRQKIFIPHPPSNVA